MDQARIWFARLVAPVVFLAAVVALVFVVDRALDDGSSSVGSGVTEPVVSVIIDTGEEETGTETASEPVEQQFYRIRSGDTLEAIAAKFDTNVETLLELNPTLDPLALSPGDRIRVA